MKEKVIITTDRLVLREFSQQDVFGFFKLNDDPEVLKYTGDKAFIDAVEAEEFIKGYSHYQRHGYGRWSIYTKNSNQYIGFCGLRYSEEKRETDIGFRIALNFWGYGYATESALAVIEFGFKQLALEKIVANVMLDNIASHSVIKKLGMIAVSEYLEADNQWIKYQTLRPQSLTI